MNSAERDAKTAAEEGRKKSLEENRRQRHIDAIVRQFSTGATRDTDDNKLDFEGFLSPLVLKRFAEYMHEHRKQKDGSVRASDNWQKGIPKEAYMQSGYRHFFDWWCHHRSYTAETTEDLENSLCALMFNVMGYLHETIKNRKDYTPIWKND